MMLRKLRDDIVKIDEQLILLLSKRMGAARELGKYKKENNIPIFDASVETAVIERNCTLANRNSLSETFVQRLYGVILEESRKVQEQEQIMKSLHEKPSRKTFMKNGRENT